MYALKSSLVVIELLLLVFSLVGVLVQQSDSQQLQKLCLYECCNTAGPCGGNGSPSCDTPDNTYPDGFCASVDEECPLPGGSYGYMFCYGSSSFQFAEQLILPPEDCKGYLEGALCNDDPNCNPEYGFPHCSGFRVSERALGWQAVWNNRSTINTVNSHNSQFSSQRTDTPPFAKYFAKFGANYTSLPNGVTADANTCYQDGCHYECCLPPNMNLSAPICTSDYACPVWQSLQ